MLDSFLDFFKRSLFTISSTIIFLSYALFFLLDNLSDNNPAVITGSIQLIPVIIGGILAFIALIFYFFWSKKQYMLVKMHMKKNYINYDTIAVTLNFFAIITLFVITIPFAKNNGSIDDTIQIAILIAFGLILLIPQGFHKFFMYKVKIDLAKRKNGDKISFDDSPKKNKTLDSKKKIENPKKLTSKEIEKDDPKKPSAGKFYE